MKKLTLSAQESTIEAAKRLAEESGTSVSAMFERYIRFLDSRTKRSKSSIAPITRQCLGIAKLSDDINCRDILVDALMEKHGIDK